MMVNFMRHLDKVARYPDIWLNVISGYVCEGVWIGRLKIKYWEIALANVGERHSFYWGLAWNQKTEEGGICSLCLLSGDFSCPQIRIYNGLQVWTGTYIVDSLGFQAFGLRPELRHLFCVSSLPLVDNGTSKPPWLSELIHPNKYYTYIYICRFIYT